MQLKGGEGQNNWHLSRATPVANRLTAMSSVFGNGDTPLISLARVREKRQLPSLDHLRLFRSDVDGD